MEAKNKNPSRIPASFLIHFQPSPNIEPRGQNRRPAIELKLLNSKYLQESARHENRQIDRRLTGPQFENTKPIGAEPTGANGLYETNCTHSK